MKINTRKFTDFNTALDKLMSDEFNQPAVLSATISTKPNKGRADETGAGTLIAQVSTAGGSVPVYGAKVTITSSDGTVISTQNTDRSGRTKSTRLPAPSSSYSREPSGVRPYSVYNMRVEQQGFYTQEFIDIAVFDKIESIQSVALEPIGEDATENERITPTVITETANS